MAINLDLKDRKILYELDKNARVSFTELGRRTGVSKQVARYRVSQLEKNGVISQYFTIMDITKLGYANTTAFIKLHNTDEKQEEKLVTWLEKNPNVVWLASCDGQFDIAFGMKARNTEEYSLLLQEVDDRFGQFFLKREIAPIVKGQYFYRDYLVGKDAGTERELAFGSVPENPALDRVDWEILRQLGENARANAVEIAGNAKISPESVGKRIKALEKEGVLCNYILVLDNQRVNQLQYKVLIRLKNFTQESYQHLTEYCKNHPNVFYVVKTFGPWEFEIDLEVKSEEEFRSIMRELKKKFEDKISDYSYINIYKVHKYNFCPEIPLGVAKNF